MLLGHKANIVGHTGNLGNWEFPNEKWDPSPKVSLYGCNVTSCPGWKCKGGERGRRRRRRRRRRERRSLR